MHYSKRKITLILYTYFKGGNLLNDYYMALIFFIGPEKAVRVKADSWHVYLVRQDVMAEGN